MRNKKSQFGTAGGFARNASHSSDAGGQITLQMLIFGTVAVIVIGGLVTWSNIIMRSMYRNANRNISFAIAEAGIEYYRWHLAHSPTDYRDGTGQPGPYVHDYLDKNRNVIGQFTLDIIPPPIGSTIVAITSTGHTLNDPSADKAIKVRMGISSYAKYAALTNSVNRFGQGTEVFGPVHSNSGMRFDGLAHNLVTSAVPQYQDPDHGSPQEFGVHTHATTTDPYPPNPVPNRPDIFMAGRQFPVPAVDFTKITQTLSQIKAGAQASGIYYASSTAFGYHLVLKTNNTFDLYKVTATTTPQSGCYNSQQQTGWDTWTVRTQAQIAASVPFPQNGLMFFEDNLWVDGQINTARLTVASGRFPENPSTYSSIIVNSDLKYTNTDGSDVLALIAQNNINIGLVSNDTLRIDGALIAENGRVGRYYYNPPNIWYGSGCSPYHSRTLITTYGMIGSNGRYGFAYTDGTGYQTRNLNYDSNLIYGPPPSFPLTTDQYALISWQEIR